MNQADSVGKVKKSKSEAELNQLLETLEKNILSGISRGIEIADSFSGETSTSQHQILAEEADRLQINRTRAVRNNTVPSFFNLTEEADKLRTNKAEASTVPRFFNLERQGWEFRNPIVLYKDKWMGAETEGVTLDKGIYKFDYIATAISSKGTGLALFNTETKKLERLLFWQLGTESSGSITNVSGTQYFGINSPNIINITDEHGNFNPRDVQSIYIVTLFRMNTLPD